MSHFFPSALCLALLLLSGCDTADEAPYPGLAVTGFVVTTPEQPEPDPARVCGVPTRTARLIAAVPNPYLGLSAYEDAPDNRRLRFINLPGRVRIEIVRAYWYTMGPGPTVRRIGGGIVRTIPETGRTVRIFEKEDFSRSLDWDLRDEAGDLVPSGFYRVFFTVENGEVEPGRRTVFDDVYVIQREDSGLLIALDVEPGEEPVREMVGDGSWVDPTGCVR